MKLLLVVPPFGPIEYPVLGPSLLKPAVEAAGASCSILYASLGFAERIGFGLYNATYYTDPPLLLGERTFAGALFGDALPSTERYWHEVVLPYAQAHSGRLQSALHSDRMTALQSAEQAAAVFVEELAQSPEVAESDVVGLSTTFAQNTAALAIARAVKRRHPEKVVILGGPNCEGCMGRQLLESFPFLDYVVEGPADHSLPELVRALAAGKAPAGVPGVRGREGGALSAAAPAGPVDLDALPFPDFSDFFAAYERFPEERKRVLALPVEGARGCWWGAKHHCIFCGIADERMGFTRKSAARLHDEIEALCLRWGVPQIWATDYILDTRYFRDLIPMLQEKHSYEEMFFEVKASLRREQMEALVAAGVTRLQPGIESLHTDVLQLMSKGTTALQNLQTLKWAKELGITLQWNVICGFPGETPEQYREMSELMEAIPHLPPPKGCSRITIDRFSPLFETPERFGVEIEPAKAYRYVYALPEDEIARLAYFYVRRPEPGGEAEACSIPGYAEDVFRRVEIWKRMHHRVAFEYETSPGGRVRLEDSRPGASAPVRELDLLESEIFRLADAAVSRGTIRRRVGSGGASRAAHVDAALERLVAARVLHREGDRYLALACARRDLRPEPN